MLAQCYHAVAVAVDDAARAAALQAFAARHCRPGLLSRTAGFVFVPQIVAVAAFVIELSDGRTLTEGQTKRYAPAAVAESDVVLPPAVTLFVVTDPVSRRERSAARQLALQLEERARHQKGSDSECLRFVGYLQVAVAAVVAVWESADVPDESDESEPAEMRFVGDPARFVGPELQQVR